MAKKVQGYRIKAEFESKSSLTINKGRTENLK
jgi:hypothetical protein